MKKLRLVETDALRILLHHEAISKHKQEVFCLLLCTSKAMAAALAAHCTGLIEVSAFLDSVYDVTVFAAWLSKHGMLLKTLSLCMGHLSGKEKTQASEQELLRLLIQGIPYAFGPPHNARVLQHINIRVTSSGAQLQQVSQSFKFTSSIAPSRHLRADFGSKLLASSPGKHLHDAYISVLSHGLPA